MSGEMKDRE